MFTFYNIFQLKALDARAVYLHSFVHQVAGVMVSRLFDSWNWNEKKISSIKPELGRE